MKGKNINSSDNSFIEYNPTSSILFFIPSLLICFTALALLPSLVYFDSLYIILFSKLFRAISEMLN